jgi:FkbM family methyltransferase
LSGLLTSKPVRAFVSRLPRGGVRLTGALTRYRPSDEVFDLPGPLNGIKMRLDTSDRFQAHMAFGVYQPDVVAAFTRLARAGDVVVTAGTHVGFMALALARLGCRVIGFEADPRNAARSRSNFSLNPNLRTELVPVGLGRENKALLFWMSDVSPQSSFAVPHYASSQISVPVRRGDDVLKELGVGHVDGLLLDVEGWECDVLEGLGETLRRHLPRWAIVECVEFALRGANRTPEELRGMIRGLGWRIEDAKAADLVCYRP